MKSKDATISPRPLNVAIVEDDEPIRVALAELLDGTAGIRCTQRYSACEEAIAGFRKRVPDVVLMDIGLPGMSGIAGTKLLKQTYPAIDIMMLTVYDDDGKIFESVCAGASGYILKSAEPAELVQAIRDIRTGAPMSPTIARRVLGILRGEARGKDNDALKRDETLTPRELEILQSLVDGLSYRRIAEKLFISPLTVHTHIKRIYEKLQVHSKSAAVSAALRHRLAR